MREKTVWIRNMFAFLHLAHMKGPNARLQARMNRALWVLGELIGRL